MVKSSLRPRLNGASLLVVDDNSDVTELLRAAFERHGAMVSTATSVEEALGVLMAHTVDLIVSDIAMPNRDGYSLITAVRDAYIVRDLPVIAYTALCTPVDRKRALKAGFSAHVCKQADLDVMLQTAEHLLVSASPRSANAPRVFWG